MRRIQALVTRPAATFEELERQRRLAVQCVRKGKKPPILARLLGANRISHCRLRRQLGERGPLGLDPRCHPVSSPVSIRIRQPK